MSSMVRQRRPRQRGRSFVYAQVFITGIIHTFELCTVRRAGIREDAR
jgi:hypothetical protein